MELDNGVNTMSAFTKWWCRPQATWKVCLAFPISDLHVRLKLKFALWRYRRTFRVKP